LYLLTNYYPWFSLYLRINLRAMRKIFILLVSSLILTISPIFISDVLADQPPDPGGGPGTGDPVGGGNPIGGGLIILATLGAAYGIKRIYDFRSNESFE